MDSYPQDYVDRVRSHVDELVRSYNRLAVTARKSGGQLAQAAEACDPLFYNNLVLTLDRSFVQRPPNKGNASDEVRSLCTALICNEGIFTLDASEAAPYSSATSVLGYAEGDQIILTVEDFERLANAFFAAIEQSSGG